MCRFDARLNGKSGRVDRRMQEQNVQSCFCFCMQETNRSAVQFISPQLQVEVSPKTRVAGICMQFLLVFKGRNRLSQRMAGNGDVREGLAWGLTLGPARALDRCSRSRHITIQSCRSPANT